MKKMFALLLAGIMILSLAACGAKEEAPAKEAPGAGDLEYVKANGKLVVGITDFAPMDYKDENGHWIGFDADMAKAFAEHLGVEVEFIQITWGNKHTELETKAIDVVWNGMTLTDDVKALMGTSDPYCKNAQVVVLKSDIADQYNSKEKLIELSFAAEDGSAGAEALDVEGIEYTAVLDQSTALMEVASGSSQACVIDLLMAGAMIGEDTSYPDLVMGIELTGEEYGVGFRKESDLIKIFNDFWKEAFSSH